jgi:hypothetical protein
MELRSCFEVLGNIQYSLINVLYDDIELTIAATNQIVSVNKMIQELKDLRKELDIARSNPFPGADFIKFKEEYPNEQFLPAYIDFLSNTLTK